MIRGLLNVEYACGYGGRGSKGILGKLKSGYAAKNFMTFGDFVFGLSHNNGLEDNRTVKTSSNHYPFADILIDVTEPVDDVINKITSCDVIATSSLHGAIVAQSFGIPWVRLYAEPTKDDFKWLDFISALDRPLRDIHSGLLDALENGVKK